MLHLRRVHFASVGHRDARLAPLTLSFVGEDERPAHTVLWLRNGGGKSSILNLLFAVLRPDRREFLGNDESGRDRHLADYVAATDTAHVVLEWGYPGQRTPAWLTGMVLEWRDRTRSADRDRLRRLWYGFVPTPTEGQLVEHEHPLTLDTLPIVQDGRRVSLTRFRERLREAGAADPNLQLVVTEVQSDWRRALEQQALDPEVFRYQLAMNREEGGASQLFKRRSRSAAEFVDLLLELVLPDEQPGKVAAVFGRYADELARRPALERDRQFLSGALERLRPFTEALAEREAAEEELAGHIGSAARLSTTLAAAARIAASDACAADEEAGKLAHEAAARERAQRAGLDAAAEARRLAADFRVALAESAFAEAAGTADRADADLRAWRLAGLVAAERAVAADAETLRRQLAEAEEGVAPLRVQLDEAAARFGARLADQARALLQEAERAAADATHHASEAGAAGERLAQASRRDGQLQTEVQTLERRRAAAAAARAAAERDDLLAPGQEADEVLAATRAEIEAVAAERAALDRRAADIAEREVKLDERLTSLSTRISEAAAAEAAARSRAEALAAAEATLIADPRLAEVAEVEHTSGIALDEVGVVLAERLSGLAAEADRRLLTEELGAVEDRRALAALDDDGLLPGRPDLSGALEVLSAGGVAAVTGWRYLADAVKAGAHEQVLAAHPELVDGVVLVDPAHLDRARTLLSEAGLRPASAVVVGTAAPLAADTGSGVAEDATTSGSQGAPRPDGRRFVLPAAAALSDRVAGEAERSARAERLDSLETRTKQLRATRDRDATLADRLRSFLGAFPERERERITADLAAREAELAEARVRQAEAARERDRLRIDRREVDQARRRLEERSGRLGRALPRLERLAELLAADLDDAARGRQLVAELDEVRTALERARNAEARERKAADAATDEAASRRAAARAVRDRLADLGFSGSPAGSAVPDEPVEVLERRWRLLDERYRQAASDPVLADRLERATSERAALRARLDEAAHGDRAAAVALLATADGAHPSRREEACAAAERSRDTAAEAKTLAQERLRVARETLGRAGPTKPGVELPEQPESGEEADRLAGSLDAQAQAAAEEAQVLRRRAAAAEKRALARRAEERELSGLAGRLRAALPEGDEKRATERAPDPDAASSLAADVPAAAASAEAAQADLTERIKDAERARKRATAAEADLRRFVLERRFDAMDGPLRDRLGRDPAAALADRAADYLEDMNIRLDQCEQQLTALEQHRAMLVREIAGRVDDALHLLRQAERASTLPDGFGGWSGQQFLHLRSDRAGHGEELFARLGVLVDTMVDRGERPEGIPLVQKAVHAAVGPRGFTVRILKPSAALRTERVPVSDLATFSGGEQLTAAVLLYCTLSQLRARIRAQRRAGGVLVLDNPIGKSSNVTLLDLQRRVADRLGVQLVYTTAVDDRDAIGTLPNRIRLRNERMDRRTGNQHVEVDHEAAAPDLDGPPLAQIAAARVWRREDPPAPSDDDPAE